MAAPATLVRTAVKSIMTAEFGGTYTVTDDKLTRAAGKDGAAEAAVWPEREVPNPRNNTELVVPVVLQLYLAYEAQPDEHIAVDPTVIEAIGDRIRRRTAQFSSGNSSDLWFIKLLEIEYPDDPTGNKSRLEARFEGHCDNPASQ